MLKHVYKHLHPYEAELASSFSSEPLSSDPDNYVAPVFEILQSPHDEDSQIFVMPFLRSFGNPRFDTFGEAVSFFEQIFRVCPIFCSGLVSNHYSQGLAFLHEHNFAHRYVIDDSSYVPFLVISSGTVTRITL
jgi:hypothetical protein